MGHGFVKAMNQGCDGGEHVEVLGSFQGVNAVMDFVYRGHVLQVGHGRMR